MGSVFVSFSGRSNSNPALTTSMQYTLLSEFFNFFIVIPQIINALIGGPLVKYAYNNEAIFALMISGFSFLIAAALVYKVKDVDDVVQTN